MNRYFGLAVALLVALIAGYEAAALLTPLPTISRVIQGWRDEGHTALVVLLVAGICLALLVFAVWVFRHLLFGPRSPTL